MDTEREQKARFKREGNKAHGDNTYDDMYDRWSTYNDGHTVVLIVVVDIDSVIGTLSS